jgi:regulator of sigma E protease
MPASSIDLLISIATFVIALGIIIFFHELGHYLVAKLFKIEVEEFGLGFPPRMIKLFKYQETEFTLNWIPFGAFVRPKGENDPSISGGLASANPWKRLAVLFGGPVANLLVGISLFALVFTQTGVPDLSKVQITSTTPDSPAALTGLKSGDILLRINNTSISSSQQLISIVNANLGKEISIEVSRGNEVLEYKAIPRVKPPDGQGPLGITMGNPIRQVSVLSAVPYGFIITFEQIRMLLSVPGQLIQGTMRPEETRVVGPVGIFGYYQQARERDQQSAAVPDQPAGVNQLWLLATISVALGMTNLFPIPALDGGRIIFVLPEIIFRKRIPARYENMVHFIGFAALLLLMIYITTQDVMNPAVLP